MASDTSVLRGSAFPQLCSITHPIDQRHLWTESFCGPRHFVPEQWCAGRRLGNGSCLRSTVLQISANTGEEDYDVAHSQQEQEEFLWREFFLDPSLWWDNRRDKKTSRSPDFRHKRTKKVLWLNSVFKPAWVESRLVMWDEQMGVRICGSTPSTLNSSWAYDAVRSQEYAGDVKVEECRRLCEKGQLAEAVEALSLLVDTGSRVSTSVFHNVLKECVAQNNVVIGRRVHALAVKGGYEANTFLGNHFLRMYTSHGMLQEATNVFNRLAAPDAFTMSAIISAHSDHGDPEEALQLYQRRSSGVKPDGHVFVAALRACSKSSDLDSGKKVHADILKAGLQSDVFVGSCLVDMYAKCGSLVDARRVFDNLPTRNVVTWNTMISGYTEHGLGDEALALYARMEQESSVPANDVTFSCILKACASIGALQKGKELYSQIGEKGIQIDVVVGSCLVDMYAQCGSLEEARRVFDSLPAKNAFTWNTMIDGYTQHGLGQEALALYVEMEGEEAQLADKFTYAALLRACAGIGALTQGKQLHSQILERGLGADVLVSNCLVDMYVKCDSLGDARLVLEGLSTRDVVTWTTMIAGYASHGLGQEALALYAEMELGGAVIADNVTFACLLKACESIGALQQGRQLHIQIVERGLETDTVVGNCLVDMYAKCGCLKEARRVFDILPAKDIVTWNIMLSGFGESNKGLEAIQCFHEMLSSGVQPNEITFICLLVACSHQGLVSEGQQYYKSMVEDYGIVPSRQHHACMVDLLSRSGKLNEAENMLLSTPFKRDPVGWTALLNACKSYGDAERGKRCFDVLTELDPQDSSAYVLMAKIFADVGAWSAVDKIESQRISVGAFKKPAEAGIEVDRKVHRFVVGEHKGGVSLKLRSMTERLKTEGSHKPQTESVLKQLSENEKEDDLCGHAEKLALAYGLLNTPDGTPLLVTKNLRMCGDCHSATQIMSRVEKREIVVRDAHRVHRFVEGACSCGDRP